MPLLDLKTDLKSLKYGQDLPGGGSSGQPYIKTDINTLKNGIIQIPNFLGFDDGLIRGGLTGAANASIIDTFRIGKFFLDLPKGPLFITKQIGLQLSNPRLETIKTSSDQESRSIFFQPTRLYNLGINTIAQVPVNAFGIHFNRHGLLLAQSENTKYENVVYKNNQNGFNRLIKLTKELELNTPTPKTGIGEKISYLSYFGGPGSVYGIGNTTIKRYTITGNKPNNNTVLNNIFSSITSEQNKSSIGLYKDDILIDINQIVDRASIYNQTRTVAQVLGLPIPGQKEIVYSNTYGQTVKINTKFDRWAFVARENRVGDFGKARVAVLVKPGTDDFTSIGGVKGTIKNNGETVGALQDVNRIDSINASPLFYRDKYWSGDNKGGDIVVPKISGNPYNVRDLIKFRIQQVSTDKPDFSKFMVFRAYLTQLSDSISGDWSDIKYVGRGSKFYIYNGFSRKLSIGFKAAALSAEEMRPMYSKLNNLINSLAPDYFGGSNNQMRGSLHRMTIGNYLDSQLGIITSLTYNVTNDTPWEISLDEPEGGAKQLILPHIIEVSMEFTPIGVEDAGTNYTEDNNNKTYIAQNNTGADKEWLQYNNNPNEDIGGLSNVDINVFG